MELFDDLHRAFDEHGLLPALRAVQNTRLIALDATWYFSSHSENIHCPNCSCQRHADGRTLHFHSAITPVIVSPGHALVVPLRPEFIVPQDLPAGRQSGHAKQDCEIAAAKRWLAAADYQLIRGKVGARRTFFEHLRALTTYLHFENWEQLMDFMRRGLELGPPATAKS